MKTVKINVSCNLFRCEKNINPKDAQDIIRQRGKGGPLLPLGNNNFAIMRKEDKLLSKKNRLVSLAKSKYFWDRIINSVPDNASNESDNCESSNEIQLGDWIPAKIKNKVSNHFTEISNTILDELNISVRASNCFKLAKKQTLADVLSLSSSDLLKMRNFGRKPLRDLVEALNKHIELLPSLIHTNEEYELIQINHLLSIDDVAVRKHGSQFDFNQLVPTPSSLITNPNKITDSSIYRETRMLLNNNVNLCAARHIKRKDLHCDTMFYLLRIVAWVNGYKTSLEFYKIPHRYFRTRNAPFYRTFSSFFSFLIKSDITDNIRNLENNIGKLVYEIRENNYISEYGQEMATRMGRFDNNENK
ncbi:DNA-directed RNA polymerase subunit alpha C-terminal domain-containing protein [Candidatus Margulisiibacteriota bacterium]